MNARFLIRLLTLTSWIPLSACATSEADEDAQPVAVGGGNAEAGPSHNANLETSIENSLNVDAKDVGFEENSNNESGNKNNANLLAEDDGGDSDFDDEDGLNGDAKGNHGPAADAGAGIDGFENNLAGENFTSDKSLGGSNQAPSTSEAIDAFKNTAIESNAFGSGNVSTDNFTGNTPPVAAAPEPAPAPAPVAPLVSIPVAPPRPVAVAAPQPVAHDIEATKSVLHWVGYKINEGLKKLDVEIVTKGRPEYEIFEQNNRMQQSELIIRFYRTTLRKKLHWDVNSSEFRSPVAYIRMKDKKSEGYVDLVITHRDHIEPLFYEKDGNFVLSYAIPERYFGSQAQKIKAPKDQAISLKGERPLAQVKAVVSRLPTVGFPRYTAQFSETPKLLPIRNFISRGKIIRTGKDGLPETFSKEIVGKRTGEILSRKTILGVAQDDVENDFEDEAPTNAANNAKNAGNANNRNAANNGGKGGNAAAGNNLTGGEFDNAGSNPDAFSDLNDKPESNHNAGKGKATKAQNEAPMDDFSSPVDTSPIPAPVDAPMMQTSQGEDVEPQDVTGRKQQYTGKPIFMDFYDSPLSLVLKSFSEETGNNFVFSAEIGSTPVTFHFKGVPWDEALKAILETYTLGMVRIGDNVVRVDKIASLTSYMQALEEAKKFETRRVPTKVMVFRLNNAVAKDISAKVLTLLARDISVDDRIKVSEDDRTNTVVIEAPENTLSKARSIIERLDLETPQVEIVSRIVEVQKKEDGFTGVGWGSGLNFDPGRALGFGTLNFPNSVGSSFSVDPGVSGVNKIGNSTFRLGSLNRFLNLDLLLKLEETKSTVNVLQTNRVLVLDGQKAFVLAGSSQFFPAAAGGNVINPAAGATVGGGSSLSEVKFNLSLEVTPQVTALGNVIMALDISSDTPVPAQGDQLASKNSRKLNTQMLRASGETGVIGGIYDTKRTTVVAGIPFLSELPIVGALFRSTSNTETQIELLIMVTPTIISGPGDKGSSAEAGTATSGQATIISQKKTTNKGSL